MRKLHFPAPTKRPMPGSTEETVANSTSRRQFTLEEWEAWCADVEVAASQLRTLAFHAKGEVAISKSSVKYVDIPYVDGGRRRIRKHKAEAYYIKMLGPFTVLEKLRRRVKT